MSCQPDAKAFPAPDVSRPDAPSRNYNGRRMMRRPELSGSSCPYVLWVAIGWLDLCTLNNSLGCATVQPTLQILTFDQRSSQRPKRSAADRLLLPSQMIVKQLGEARRK